MRDRAERSDAPSLLAEMKAAREWRDEAETLIHHALRLGAEGRAVDCQMLLRRQARRWKWLRELALRWPGNVLRDSDKRRERG